MGGVAQCYGESVPVLVLPMGICATHREYRTELQFQSGDEGICEVGRADQPRQRGWQHLPPRLHQAEKRPRRPGDRGNSLRHVERGSSEPLNYTPVLRTRYGADPVDVKQAAALLVSAKRPVIYAGQGVHYAKAWPQLKRLAERLAIPVTTSLGGKSSFPETHPLSLGSGRSGCAARGAEIPWRGRRDFRASAAPSPRRRLASPCPRTRPSSIRRSNPAHLNKDVEGQNRAGRRCRTGARCAARGDQQEHHSRPRCECRRRRDRRFAQGVAGEMDAETDP